MSSWTLGTVDYCRDGGLLLPLQRRAEAKTTYGGDHLLDGDLGGVEGHDRFLRLEAYVRPIHAIQPFQGLLDRDGSGPSRHSINGEDDGRGRRHPDVHGDHEAEQQGEDGRPAFHRILPMS